MFVCVGGGGYTCVCLGGGDTHTHTHTDGRCVCVCARAHAHMCLCVRGGMVGGGGGDQTDGGTERDRWIGHDNLCSQQKLTAFSDVR